MTLGPNGLRSHLFRILIQRWATDVFTHSVSAEAGDNVGKSTGFRVGEFTSRLQDAH